MAHDQDGDHKSGDEDFATLLAASDASSSRRIAAGELARGRVVAVGATNAFVEIGGKGEAVIDVSEFRDPETGALQIAVGDQIEATIVDDGHTSGTIVLKRTVGRGGHVTGELEQALALGIPVEGLVTAETKGGFAVVATSARPGPRRIGFADLRERLRRPAEPVLLLFGTGWGLAPAVLDRADALLEPVIGPTDYNHLSVRSAVAVILDRLCAAR